MKTLLVINSSARVSRSITRHLTSRFVEAWLAANPGGKVVSRDVGLHSPATIDEQWIAAAFAKEPAPRDPLQLSDALIDELVHADAIVIGTPMYNFGMPAHLKAYFDQVVRVGRTFSFDAAAEEPYRPLLESKPVVLITSVGDGALLPGGELAHLNFLEPHLATILGFIGLTNVSFIRVGFDEYQDGRLRQSLSAAEAAVVEAVGRLTGGLCDVAAA